FVTDGACPSRQRFGFSLFNWSKMTFELPHTSPPPGMVLLRNPSTDFHRQATFRRVKLSRVIWSSGEYLLLPGSPPDVRHSPFCGAPRCAWSGTGCAPRGSPTSAAASHRRHF